MEKVSVLGRAKERRALLKIQKMLDPAIPLKCPTLRACGITEKTAEALAAEELIELYELSDDGAVLEKLGVRRILPDGQALLANSKQDSSFFPTTVLMESLGEAAKVLGGVILGLVLGYLKWKLRWI